MAYLRKGTTGAYCCILSICISPFSPLSECPLTAATLTSLPCSHSPRLFVSVWSNYCRNMMHTRGRKSMMSSTKNIKCGIHFRRETDEHSCFISRWVVFGIQYLEVFIFVFTVVLWVKLLYKKHCSFNIICKSKFNSKILQCLCACVNLRRHTAAMPFSATRKHHAAHFFMSFGKSKALRTVNYF